MQEKNREDIEKYTCHLLEKPIFSSYGDDTLRKIEDYIVKHADGVFLWVRVIGDELEKYCRKGLSPNEILRFLEVLPRELEGYYVYILQGLSTSDKYDIRDGTRILQFVCSRTALSSSLNSGTLLEFPEKYHPRLLT